MRLTTRLLALCLASLAVHSDCLDKNVLTSLGFSTLAAPETVPYPSYCKKVNATAKTCTNQDSLAALLSSFQSARNKVETGRYKTLRDTIEPLVRKFHNLTKDLADEKTFGKNVITDEARAAIEEAKAFMPEKGGDLAKQIKKAKTACLAAQNAASVGAICVMSTDVASNYVKVRNADDGTAPATTNPPPAAPATTTPAQNPNANANNNANTNANANPNTASAGNNNATATSNDNATPAPATAPANSNSAPADNKSTTTTTTTTTTYDNSKPAANSNNNNAVTATDGSSNTNANANNTNNANAATGRRLAEVASTSPYVFEVTAQQNAQDAIIEACFPVIKAACAYRQVGLVIDNLNRTTVRDRRGCYKEILGCESNVNGCSAKAKSLIVQNLFGVFNNSLVDEVELEEVDDFLTDHAGNLWDKTEEAADDVRDSTVNAYNKSAAYVKSKFAKDGTATKEVAAEPENEVEHEDEAEHEVEHDDEEPVDNSNAAPKTTVTTTTTVAPANNNNNAAANGQPKSALRRRLAETTVVSTTTTSTNTKAVAKDKTKSSSSSEEDDEKDAKNSGKNVDLSRYPKATYNINSNGYDLATEANYSGVAIKSANVLSVLVGLVFVSAQYMF